MIAGGENAVWNWEAHDYSIGLPKQNKIQMYAYLCGDFLIWKNHESKDSGHRIPSEDKIILVD
ncbi:MAG: hypothetical protein HC880_14915 [Bacteroidia bacterium]|nr:hypothetical protein [Bacteroidia bacterium]